MVAPEIIYVINSGPPVEAGGRGQGGGQSLQIANHFLAPGGEQDQEILQGGQLQEDQDVSFIEDDEQEVFYQEDEQEGETVTVYEVLEEEDRYEEQEEEEQEEEEEGEVIFEEEEEQEELSEQVIYVSEEGLPIEGEVTFMQVTPAPSLAV